MKRDAAIDVLLRRAGQRQGDSTLRTQLEEEMQLAQEVMEQNGVPLPLELGGGPFWPHFLVSEMSSNTTTKDEPRVALPSDFVMEYEDGALFFLDGGKFKSLIKDDWDILRSNYDAEKTDKPKYYSITGKYFYLFPVPDAAYDLRLVYYQTKDTLDSNIENDWLRHAPNLLISYVGEVMAGQVLYDEQLRKIFQREYSRAAIQVYYADVARQQANYDAVKGDRV